ncbi:MAG: hypothetical protein JWL77_99 [Chthonomonadaceae bacterium]|jgi:hypothetical protein|nr:hypothetical protein [Chthonomonadaceae bacterium]
MLKWMHVAACLLALPGFSRAEPPIDAPKLAILPAAIRNQGETDDRSNRSRSKFNPQDVVNRVIPKIVAEAEKKKWGYSILAPEQTSAAYVAVVGDDIHSEGAKFNQLKALAEKIHARYLVRFSINELTSYRKTNTFTAMAEGRAAVDLYVYDADVNEYVWQAEETSTSARGDVGHFGSLSQRQDQALQNAMMRALEPFIKGERKKVGRPRSNVVATIQKVIADGKKVVLDVGADHNLSAGDILTSVESDSILTITEVLANGSIAEVTKGTPKEKEVFKSGQ